MHEIKNLAQKSAMNDTKTSSREQDDRYQERNLRTLFDDLFFFVCSFVIPEKDFGDVEEPMRPDDIEEIPNRNENIDQENEEEQLVDSMSQLSSQDYRTPSNSQQRTRNAQRRSNPSLHSQVKALKLLKICFLAMFHFKAPLRFIFKPLCSFGLSRPFQK